MIQQFHKPVNNNVRPIVFFGSTLHFGGAIKSTLSLIEEVNKYHPVFVIDVYGYCPEYIKVLREKNIKYEVLCPTVRNPIIGGHGFYRLIKAIKASWGILKVIFKSKRVLNKLCPCLIWLNSRRAMFIVGRSVGKKFPTLLFVRGKDPQLNRFFLSDWKNLSLIVGNNVESLKRFKKYEWLRDKLCVAHNGISIDLVQKPQSLLKDIPCASAKIKVIMPATLIPLKAHSVAIKGFSQFSKNNPDSVLWICGDTPNKISLDYEHSLFALCRELSIEDKVHFLGWRNDVPAIMQKADIMILTSQSEGLPRSILEAMACGVAVVATQVGGIPEVIQNKKNGILINVDAPDELARALEKFNDKEFRKKLTQSALDCVKSKFTIEKQAGTFIEIIRPLIS